ncbi:cytochrome c oxidase subunit II [Alicyclobacillus cycloheptanicus]|uniref:Cytochrome c oxidase subunit 2 n=1 Tax=Alicyclobacillus cycloheptanicus TaxID=1457 RepID=A0ABT9XJ46_9BACL|nr:cytochrome c oxidase subunit II [Alicyclobacillus cycloheptanicus]MDQ0190303.1 cytochrome c oxidase subunit 2 [Alicyclobacillus cycloheptanicus]WDM00049.1 cytochrome c oxidase subunit II [Alicyclobacillus cycloheptanicus]
MPNVASWLPPALTQMAQRVDSLFYIVLGIVAAFFVIVEVLLITFLIRYRRTRKNRTGKGVHGNNLFEIIWTLVPTVILVFMGVISVKYVYAQQTPPPHPVVIKVTGHMWYWEFQYPNGLDTRNVLDVPAGQPVLFDITSADVIHGFYIPAVRVQQDALPGRQTQFWMQADTKDIGQSFPVPCDQFCGVDHSKMHATMTVLSPSDFQQWEASQLQKQKASSGS